MLLRSVPIPILSPYVKRFNCESADELTDRQKDTQKYGTDSMTSTADAGGKNDQI